MVKATFNVIKHVLGMLILSLHGLDQASFVPSIHDCGQCKVIPPWWHIRQRNALDKALADLSGRDS
jgi:hypothetical protein